MMQVTYLGHSGFLLEWPECYWLFDWWKGELPSLDPSKPLLVFASHRHHDHFDPHIFLIDHPEIRWYLASDIRLTPKNMEKWGVPANAAITSVRRRQHYIFSDAPGGPLELEALPSTDAGVAFLLTWQGRTVYHAGDLNWWDWPGESDEWNHNMAANFRKATVPLEGRSIDLAFVPLDGRQEASYALGMEWFLTHTHAAHVFPMHFWDAPETIGRFCSEYPQFAAPIIALSHSGQIWTP